MRLQEARVLSYHQDLGTVTGQSARRRFSSLFCAGFAPRGRQKENKVNVLLGPCPAVASLKTGDSSAEARFDVLQEPFRDRGGGLVLLPDQVQPVFQPRIERAEDQPGIRRRVDQVLEGQKVPQPLSGEHRSVV